MDDSDNHDVLIEDGSVGAARRGAAHASRARRELRGHLETAVVTDAQLRQDWTGVVRMTLRPHQRTIATVSLAVPAKRSRKDG